MRHRSISVGEDLLDAVEVTREALNSPGAIVLSSFPVSSDCQELLTFARGLGRVSQRGVSSPQNPWTHRVAEHRDPMLDSTGQDILSTTARQFDFHTDETFSSAPADIVIQLCVRPAQCGGGLTTLAFLPDIVGLLPEQALCALLHSSQPAAGLSSNEASSAERYWIRYNPHDLRRASLTGQDRAAIAALKAAIEKVAYRIQLGPGDCLVLNNRTVLHGRTAFSSPSQRLLYRVRVHSDCREPSLER